jgi:hypothetical protein
MLKTITHGVCWTQVCKTAGIDNVRVSLRLRGAGYRRYSSKPENVSPKYSRHWFRHILVAYSQGGISPLPLPILFSIPDGFPVDCYLGMVRFMLWESCQESLKPLEQVALSLESTYGEDICYLAEAKMLKSWLVSCQGYVQWHSRAAMDYSITIDNLLDPPAAVFRPDRKDQLNKDFQYGRLFRCYDLVRSMRKPLPLEGRGKGRSCDSLSLEKISSMVR